MRLRGVLHRGKATGLVPSDGERGRQGKYYCVSGEVTDPMFRLSWLVPSAAGSCFLWLCSQQHDASLLTVFLPSAWTGERRTSWSSFSLIYFSVFFWIISVFTSIYDGVLRWQFLFYIPTLFHSLSLSQPKVGFRIQTLATHVYY